MDKTGKHIPFLFSAVLLVCIMFVIHPYYRYYIDTDATSYLTIAERYARGAYFKAINGYWSPWACWLTAILIKTGEMPFTAAIMVNTVAAICFLFISNSFFRLFNIGRTWQWTLSITTTLFLSYAIYKQSFDDLWECFFLLVCLRIMLHKDFLKRWDLWVWMGVSGGFAYYAKAYSFPFFILSTVCAVFYLTKGWERENRMRWLKISCVAIGVMILIAAPWVYLLHEKYGIWMTSTAGTLNLSWYPLGHPIYKDGILHLLPPAYPDSPSYWEDPWLVNGPTPHFWNSGTMFMKQVLRVGYDALLLVKCLNEISPFMIPALGLAAALTLSKQLRDFFGEKAVVLAIVFIIFLLGFLPINYEARYIWYTYLPGMLLAVLGLDALLKRMKAGIAKGKIITVFAFSFIAYPLWDMKQMYMVGRDEYLMAMHFKETEIRGSFTSNITFGTGDGGDALQSITRLAYYSGNSYYCMPYSSVPNDELLQELRRYNVKYFFYYMPSSAGNVNLSFLDEKGSPFPEVRGGFWKNYRIFRLYP